MANLHLNKAKQQYDRGVIAASEGRVEEALAAFTRALEIEPTYVEALAGKGTALAQLERYDEAIAILSPLLEANPDNPLVLYGMALALLGIEDDDSAYELLTRAVDAVPEEPDMLFSFGQLFSLLGYPEDASDLYRRIIALDAKQLNAYLALGHALSEMGEMNEAIATLRQAVDLAPKNDATHFALGLVLMLAGEFRDAENTLRRALALNDRNAQAHAALAEVLLQLDKEREALSQMERALKLAPDEPGVLFSAGELFSQLGRPPEAKDLFLRGLALAPEDHEAHIALVGIAAQMGDEALLRQEYDYMREMDPVMAAMMGEALGLGEPKARRKAAKPKIQVVGAGDPSAIYQLKITLLGLRPPIWRRVLVPGKTTLAQLHNIIQIVMGWTNSHLHSFTVDGFEYSDPSFELGHGVQSEKRATLAQVAPVEKSRFGYLYDFGDSWEHDILVEKILPADPKGKYPVCVKGKRNGPPEDIGGVWGYADYLEAINDPTHPDHEEMSEWFDEPHDPEAFDIDGINAHLARVR